MVHAGDAGQLGLEMRDRARRRIVRIEVTERPSQQFKQFRFAMIALGANLNELNKIRCGLRAQIITANPGERILEHRFGERVQIRPSAAGDLNFCFEEQVQLSGKRAFCASRTLGDRLNATERFSAPRDNQTRVAEFALPQEDGGSRFHSKHHRMSFWAKRSCNAVDEVREARLSISDHLSGDAQIKSQRCLKAWPHASHFVAALCSIRHRTNPPWRT